MISTYELWLSAIYAQWFIEIRKCRIGVYISNAYPQSQKDKIHERRDSTLDPHDGAIQMDVISAGDNTVSIHCLIVDNNH